MKWKNKIVGEGEEDAGQLLANPNNWRIHPHEQQSALTSVLDEVGWVQRINGHLRVHLALARGEETKVPVVYVELTPDEEALVLATLDPLGAMAATDKGKLAELLDNVKVNDEALLSALGGTSKQTALDLYEPDKAVSNGQRSLTCCPKCGFRWEE